MKYTIVRMTSVKSARIDRIGRDDKWVIYTTDEGHTDSVTLPAEDFTPEKLDAAVLAHETANGTYRQTTREI